MRRVAWLGGLAAACASDPPCPVTWDNYAEGFFVGYCETCHAEGSPNRHDAPDAVSFGTEADALRLGAAIRLAVLSDTPTMPPGGGLTPDELALLDDWLSCAEAEAR